MEGWVLRRSPAYERVVLDRWRPRIRCNVELGLLFDPAPDEGQDLVKASQPEAPLQGEVPARKSRANVDQHGISNWLEEPWPGRVTRPLPHVGPSC